MEELNEIIYPDMKDAPAKEIAFEIVRILDKKKAGDIKMLHVEEKTVLTEYFVICTGTSNTQIRSLTGDVEEEMAKRNVRYCAEDGFDGGYWIVTDYGPVILHIFNRETREFYNLEKLWSDSSAVDLTGIITED